MDREQQEKNVSDELTGCESRVGSGQVVVHQIEVVHFQPAANTRGQGRVGEGVGTGIAQRRLEQRAIGRRRTDERFRRHVGPLPTAAELAVDVDLDRAGLCQDGSGLEDYRKGRRCDARTTYRHSHDFAPLNRMM